MRVPMVWMDRRAVRNFYPVITARPEMPVRLGLAPYQKK
jgi:hypothetical protein